jgi:hypothetical protein
MCFLDAKKAFDRVNHFTLFKRLIERRVPLYLVKLLHFWYREQEFYVKWGNSSSEFYRCTNGIRQGGQLSPLLYNVYIDELNDALCNAAVGCYVGNTCVNTLSYADDMVLIAPTVNALQCLITTCSQLAKPYDIVYNTTKTECMLVKPRGSKCHYAVDVFLDNVKLNYVNEFKYLGHILTADCTDDKDIAKQLRRQNAVGNMIIRKFSFAPEAAKIQLFKSYCYPIYCNALWKQYFKYSVKKLTVSYNDTFKRLLQVPRYFSSSQTFVENHTDHIKIVFRKAIYSLMNRVQNSNNRILSAICNSDAYYQSTLLTKWRQSLYTI